MSVQTMTSETSTEKGVVGSIRSLARRLSGTFVGTRNLPSLSGIGKDKRPPIYSYDDESGQLKIGGVTVHELAENFKTPLYVYDIDRIVDNFRLYISALQASVPNNNFLLGYGVKANPSLGIIDLMKRLGAEAGTDENGSPHLVFNCTSGGEIARVQAAGVDLSTSVIYSGLGKTPEEIETAVQSNIYLFNVESWQELEQIEAAARKLNKEVNVSIRVNPEVILNAATIDGPMPTQHRFGISLKEVVEMAVRAKASAFLKVKGLAFHLQFSGGNIEPYIEARDKLLGIAETLRSGSRIYIEHINLGGGFPIGLGSDLPVWIEKLAKPVADRGLRVILSPGRSLVGDAGLLISRVTLVKKVNVPIPGSGTSSPRRGSLAGIAAGVGPAPGSPVSPTSPMNFEFTKVVSLTGRDTKHPPTTKHEVKNMAILDASLFDFGGLKALAPSIAPVFRIIPGLVTPKLITTEFKYDIVGSTSEAGDVFGRDLSMAEELKTDSLVAFTDSGAYAFSFAGNYATRVKPAEVLVKDKSVYLIRERETSAEVFIKEKIAPINTSLFHPSLKEESPTQE